MCGISGIVARDTSRYRDAQERMVKSMYHRGPDSNGIYNFDNCTLGHNRLSIVDLVSGDQPMLGKESRTGIVFNGEIYGYKSIREQLQYDFATTSDTEVILALYQQYGTDMLDRLPGMFAFGLWDNEKQSFFAARDRFGEKPFYYAITANNELVFASEIKAIIASGLIKPEIDAAAVSRYLSYGYIGPVKTIYKNVHSLPPAHYLTFSNGSLHVERYWNYPTTTTENISLSDAAEKFEALFTDAVKKQMVADVDVCAFLSGGLDSTSVVSVAHKVNPQLKTLAFGYKNEVSELPYAKMAADMYKTDHHELFEEGANFEDLFLKLPDIYDEPFSDSSAIATYLICKSARRFGKVALTGDGGDELLGGYTWWYKPMLEEIALRGAGSIKSGFAFAMAVSEKIKEKAKLSTGRDWRNRYSGIQRSKLYPTVAESAAYRVVDRSITTRLGLPGIESLDCFWQQDNTINDAMKVDIANYMPGDILVKTDRAAMANSLELRAPFLDVNLAEFCISMPGNLKIDDKADKILLREAMGKYMPEKILKRDKQGFGVSRTHWSESTKLQKMYGDFVHDKQSALYNILPYKETSELLADKPELIHQFFVLAVWANKKYSI
ncbi:MAG: asparagine synthase (glutamine-hydrolyzing) [Chitinophagaceae bacterium]|nr:asparagine synthase (glutamine-hydrolyzing) [Chitinophagaceae bacterium]MCB9046932.1 asparagine synthase (glutamine-hydrolyzing) [Chitinophagales bacterium]